MLASRILLRSNPLPLSWIKGHGSSLLIRKSMSTSNGLFNIGLGRTKSLISQRKSQTSEVTIGAGAESRDMDRNSGDFMNGMVSFYDAN